MLKRTHLVHYSPSQPTSRPDSFVSSASEPGDPEAPNEDGSINIPVENGQYNPV